MAIRSGALRASTLLLRLNTYSRRNPLYRALQELGRAVRTIYLLGWINDDQLREEVTATTNKVESFHAFAQHLNFGSTSTIPTRNPLEQEKRAVYNQLVSNAVMLQSVADQTSALNRMRDEGSRITSEDLAALSPYGTGKLRRFGEYRSEYEPEPAPETALRGR